MGEPASQAGSRQIIIIATVVTVVFFTFILIGIRSCSAPAEKSSGTVKVQESKPSAYVVIYSNLDLKDSALVITRLKELKIPYQIKDEGRSIAVPRGKSDEARLGLAEKNLPAGGTVGWEIFDQSKLGATDFDRRIQFIRAISGELSRTINRISAVEDARVQIVIPETKLFEVSKAPVTASVMLKLKPGETLTSKQVNGIVHLVAGSVENLKPDNITIIDTGGNILTTGAYTEIPQKENIPSPVIEEQKTEEQKEEVVITKEEGKAALDVQARIELEDKLTSKAQSLLNKIYPPNISIVRANIDSIKNRKTTVIILVDKTYKMSQALKKTTFETVAAAVGYDKNRGDKIILKSVTFHATGMAQPQKVETKENVISLATIKTIYRKFGRVSAVTIIIVLIMLVLLMVGVFRGKGKAGVEEETVAEAKGEKAREEIPVVDQMKTLASQNPELVAELIKTWVAGEGT